MDNAPLPIFKTPKETISEVFKIKQKEKNYKLKVEIFDENICLNLLEEKDIMEEYGINLTLSELKQIHKIFSMFNSCQDFLDYMKALIENKKLAINNTLENQITIELIVEYLFKQNIIKIDLNKKKVNFEIIAKDLYKKISSLNENYLNIIQENKNIKEENKNLNKENKNLNEEIKNVKDRVNDLENVINLLKKDISLLKDKNNNMNLNIKLDNSIDSAIMEKGEFNMIKTAIQKRMNKEIKNLKKLYQATIDGGGPEIFHKKCDNIPNTLVLYKSAGNRRFGAFVSEFWRDSGNDILDKNCFLFSLDKQKIYYPKNEKYFKLACYSYDGPGFVISIYYCIELYKNALQTKSLKTNEKNLRKFLMEMLMLCPKMEILKVSLQRNMKYLK
jgi:hypothetical protein